MLHDFGRSLLTTLGAAVAQLRRGVVFARRDGDRVITVRVVRAAPLVAWALALAAYTLWPVAATASVVGALSIALVTALWIVRAQSVGLYGERRLISVPIQVGDEIEEQITLVNTTRFPLVVVLEDASTLPGYGVTSVQSVGGIDSRSWRIDAICSRRGIATLGPWSAGWRDPLGLFEAQVRFGQHHDVVVAPPLARAPVALGSRRVRRGDQAVLRTPLRADSAQASAVRRYAAGDPLRRIHWPTSARQQALYVRQMDPESASDIWIVPDFAGGLGRVDVDNDPTLERLILLTVAVADQLIGRRLRVGLTFAAPTPTVVPARVGRPQLWSILRALAPVSPSPRPFTAILTETAAVVPARARLVVLSADVDADWPARAAAAGRATGIDLVLLDPTDTHRAERIADALTQRGWSAQAVSAEAVQPLLGAFGPLRRWEFQALGTGRVVARQTPRSEAEAEALAR